MKKNLIAIIALSLFASAAFADDSGNSPGYTAAVNATERALYLSEVSPTVKWVGAGVGTRFGVNGGAAWRVSEAGATVRMAVGATADLFSVGGKIVALPQGVFMFATECSPAFMVRTGYSPRTGATIGTDVSITLPLASTRQVSARAGVTAFEKSVDGSRGVFQIGLARSF